MQNKTILELFKYALMNSFNIEGRACRWEYNSFCIVNALISIFFGVASFIMTLSAGELGRNIAMGLSGIVSLILLPAGFCLSIRRLHDLNLSGWYLLAFVIVLLIPIVNLFGLVALIYFFMIKKGSDEPNDFGPVSINY